MTSDQEAMWKVLTNDAEFLCHKWGREMSLLKGKKFRNASDRYLKFVVDNFELEEGTRIVMTWLNHYQLPFEPDKLASFDDFHAKFGNYIVHEIKNIKAYV